MRKMRKFLNILFLCTLALGLSSCEPDDGEDYYIYDTLPGGIWVGDLGFADAYNSPLESGLYFEGNGLGRDEQAYYNDPYGEVAFSLPFRWDIHGRILRLDYGYNYPLLEIYDVYVAGDRLSGVLYVDGHMDGPVMLERQYKEYGCPDILRIGK